ADEEGQGLAGRAVVGRQPIVQELKELAELYGVLRADVHWCCPAAWRMVVVTRRRLRWSRPGMTSRRLTGWPAARLAAIWMMRCSPLEAGRRPLSRAVMTASQSIYAIGVPSLMLGAVSMWRVKSSRCRNTPWLMISPLPASSGWMPAAAARSAALSWLVIGLL